MPYQRLIDVPYLILSPQVGLLGYLEKEGASETLMTWTALE